MPQVRELLDETFENILAGKVTARQGLDEAVRKGNDLLRQFERINR